MRVFPGRVSGTVRVPPSKSHTIRAILVAAVADGTSTIYDLLTSADADSALHVAELFGSRVGFEQSVRLEEGSGRTVTIVGTDGPPSVQTAEIDVGNSGTTLFLATSLAALGRTPVRFTGDAQTRRRTAGPLLSALSALGATIEAASGGCVPYTVSGPLHGGTVHVSSPTSQYLSSLLLAAPLIDTDETRIIVDELNEHPYVDMTLSWLDSQGIRYERRGYDELLVPGRRGYHGFRRRIPGDFSSATFWACAAAITGGPVVLDGIEMTDPQGDKEVLHVLERQGCRLRGFDGDAGGSVEVSRPADRKLEGGIIDLNAMPDALPALCAVGAYCREPLRLTNVAHARAKETDRVAVMAQELAKLGVRCETLPDGIVVHPAATVHGGRVHSHGDHRVAMALAVAALGATDPVEIVGADACAVTYPLFFRELGRLQS